MEGEKGGKDTSEVRWTVYWTTVSQLGLFNTKVAKGGQGLRRVRRRESGHSTALLTVP